MNYSKSSLFKKGTPVAVYKNRSLVSENSAVHTHDFIEIIYILSGSCIQTVDRDEYAAKEGDLLFITIGQRHSFRVKENETMQYFNILIDPNLINRSIINSGSFFETRLLTVFEDVLKTDTADRFISFCGDERLKTENILNEMYIEYQKMTCRDDTVLMGYLTVLFAYMYRKFRHETERDAVIPHEAMQYIDEHFTETVSLAELSKRCLYSPKYFSKLFKDRFGISLTEYIQRKRIDMGKSLLTETDYRIDTVSETVGYSNTAHFHRYFKKWCGITPNEYRKKYRSSKET